MPPESTPVHPVRERIARLKSRLALPAFAAPMFLVSGPELVIACCRAGIVGSFPTLNARPLAELERWFGQITGELAVARERGENPAPWAANLIVHRSNPRAEEDLALTLRYQPEIVITALGTPAAVVEGVHGYGGLVFADVNSVAFARKAVAAGVDGLVLISSGAGGHTGALTPFAFVAAVREFFEGPLVIGGGIANGRAVRAAEVLGADFAYLGTRFIATAESQASSGYKQMLVDCTEEDLLLTAHFTGVPANYLRPSIEAAGLKLEELGVRAERKFDHRGSDEAKAWRDIWAAGQGVRQVKDAPPVAELVAALRAEYRAARDTP